MRWARMAIVLWRWPKRPLSVVENVCLNVRDGGAKLPLHPASNRYSNIVYGVNRRSNSSPRSKAERAHQLRKYVTTASRTAPAKAPAAIHAFGQGWGCLFIQRPFPVSARSSTCRPAVGVAVLSPLPTVR